MTEAVLLLAGGMLGALITALGMRRRQQRLLRDAQERARRRERRFLADAAHELRTPLHAIVGFARGLDRGDFDTEPSQRAATHALRAEAERMQHLASRLLDFAHATAVDIQLTPESVDLAQELRATVEVHAADARSRAVTLEVVDGHGAMVTADRIRLRQVLANLVTNAARHAPEGSVAHFALTPAEDRVTLTCANPLGETRPDPDRLFERLYHADRSGTGLGLAIARRLSERMGGELMAAVERDHIRFDLTLPAAR